MTRTPDSDMFGEEIKFVSTVSKMGTKKIILIPPKMYEELDKVKPQHVAVWMRPIINDDTGEPI